MFRLVFLLIIIIITITNTQKNCLQEDAAGKKLFPQTTPQKKIVCLEKISIPPLQKNNGPSLRLFERPFKMKKNASMILISVTFKIYLNFTEPF